MRNPQPKSPATSATAALEGDSFVEVRAWVTRQLRFEDLITHLAAKARRTDEDARSLHR